MNLIQLIDKLERQLQAIETALTVLRAETQTPTTATKLLHGLRTKKPYSFNGKHWTQLPQNRKRVIAMAKARATKRKS